MDKESDNDDRGARQRGKVALESVANDEERGLAVSRQSTFEFGVNSLCAKYATVGILPRRVSVTILVFM